ncbi:hypothetical protein F4861DRAFT_534431 [Xylaria intraflava]|nr:hypothetical protein F4861DRAFT_534431 [Xylaria intraflava]
MVGVPGRSKGCSTCRKRKKGCDKKRPICTQCSTAGLECGGYGRKTVFLNYTQDTEANAVRVVYRAESADSGQTPGGVTDIVLSQGLAQGAYVEQYISVFLSKYLPKGRSLPTSRQCQSANWVETAHALYPSNSAIQFSLLSLGLSAAGESQYALESYSRALRKLQAAVCVPHRAQSDATLAACQILSLFEVFYGSEDNALLQGSKWHSHLAGQLALIQARSPYAYQSGASHQFFSDGRYPLLFSALKNRQRFPLNTPEWRTVPWEKEPKSAKDKLYDIIADLTTILADADEMRYCHDPARKAILYEKVVRACQCLHQSLQGWLEKTGPLADFRDGSGILADPTGPFDFMQAHMTLLYWTIYATLYSTLISIHDPPLSEIPPSINPLPYIRNVANSLHYFLRPGAGLCGADFAALPLGICWQIAYATPDLYQKENALFAQLIGQQNVRDTVLNFLRSLQRDTAGPVMATLDGFDGIILRAQSWMMGKC